MGDGESMEGNIWEALNFAGFYKLDNLCAIIDCNRDNKFIMEDKYIESNFPAYFGWSTTRGGWGTSSYTK